MGEAAYKLGVRDHNFVWIDSNNCGFYVGRPRMFDDTFNIVVFIGMAQSSTYGYNALACRNVTYCVWAFLFDPMACVSGYPIIGVGGSTVPANYYTFGIDDCWHFVETPIISYTTREVLGVLDGVGILGTSAIVTGLATNDIITVDSQDWIVQGGYSGTLYWSAVSKK
jgi:hypothetical protein